MTPEEIAEAIRAASPDQRVNIPTAEQSAVIEAPVAPLLVVAGAGSGKTTTMADRVVWLVVNGHARPEEILGLTFSRKAAAELGSRVRRNLATAARVGLPVPSEGLEPAVSTYNSFAASIVRDHALAIGKDPDSRVITDAGAYQMVDQIVADWPGDLGTEYAVGTVVDAVMSLSEGLSSHLVPLPEARRRLENLITEVGQERSGERRTKNGRPKDVTEPVQLLEQKLRLLDVVEEFRNRKNELSLIQYSDQVELACQIARTVPAAAQAARSRYPVVLLDEFQDTSSAQLLFLRDLFGAGHPVMAVGDPNQAIYGWRGASASSLVDFRTAFAPSGGKVPLKRLTISWRNDSAILEAANAISAPLAEIGGSAGELLEDLAERPGVGPGSVERQVTMTAEEEAGGIAAWIGARWAPGSGTAAVLCRTKGQFGAIVRALEEAGLPAQVVGLTGLLATPEVADLRAALLVAGDAARADAAMRLLTNYRLGLADLDAIAAWAVHLAGEDARGAQDVASTLVEVLEDLPPDDFRSRSGNRLSSYGRECVRDLAGRIRRIRALFSLPLPELVQAAERILGLDIEVVARAGKDPAFARANLDAFAGHAAEYVDGSVSASLAGFLSWLDSAESNEAGLEIAEVEPTTAAVQVLTLHASKGLEWDSVAIAGMAEMRFPSIKSLNQDQGWVTKIDQMPYPLRSDSQHLPRFSANVSEHAAFKAAREDFGAENLEHQVREERRLAYVGITRARSALLLSTSHYVGGVKPRALSRFLEELLDLAPVGQGLEHVPAPAADARWEESSGEAPPSYPETDPLPPARRARLDAAEDAVRRWQGSADAADASARLGALAAEVAGTPAASLVDEARLLLAEREERRAGASMELPGQLSATSAMALVADPVGFGRDVRRPIPSEPRPQARLGTEFHTWVESHFQQPALLSDDGEDILSSDDIPEAGERIADLRAAFLSSHWAARQPSHVELGLETTVAGRTIRCRIDAVFTDAGHVEVVDWKTGRRPSSEAWPTRQLQLSLYRLAYARVTGTPLAQVRAAFHYVRSGTTLWAGSLTEAQIEEQVGNAIRAVPSSGPQDVEDLLL